MVFRRKTVDAAHTTKDSPAYGLISEEVLTALGVAGALMIMTIAGMLLIADTPLALIGMVLFGIPIVGVIVFGILLTAGRHLGLRGLANDNPGQAVVGAFLSVGTYAWFGGLVLTPYSPALYVPAISITGVITVAISLIAAAYVYTTDKSLEHWAKYSMACFVIGLVALFIGLLFPPLLLVTFAFFLLGFLCDLVYEIWMTSNRNRSPKANGLAIYIAFAGVFVHILQLVLRILARK